MGWWSDKLEQAKQWGSEVADSAVELGTEAWQDTKDFVELAKNDPAAAWDKTQETLTEASIAGLRAPAILAQGAVMGVGSGVASIGDFAVNVGYNWTTRHAINAFRDEDLEKYDSDFSGSAGEFLRVMEPRNDFERAAMASGQAVGEVGVFIAVTVGTAGIVGALVGASAATVRATTVGARAIQAAKTGADGMQATGRVSQAFVSATQGTANVLANGSAVTTGLNATKAAGTFLNPLTSTTALAMEGMAVGYDTVGNFDEIKAIEAQMAAIEGVIVQSYTERAQAVTNKHDYIQAKHELLQVETKELTDKYNAHKDGSAPLSADELDAMNERYEVLKQSNGLLDELSNSEISDERAQEIRQTLEQTLPDQEAPQASVALDDIKGQSLVAMSGDKQRQDTPEQNVDKITPQVRLETLSV